MIWPRHAGVLVLLCIVAATAACGSTDASRAQAQSAPAPAASAPDLATAALAEDHQKGRCDRPQNDFDGLFTSVRTCARGDLDAGWCTWGGTAEGLNDCELGAGDENNLGAFVRELRDASAGGVRGLDDVRGRTVRLSVYFSDLAEWQRWQDRHEAETLDRALAIWAPVYHRNHSVEANACVQLIDKAFVGGDLAAWRARADGPDVVVAERCEGD